MPNVVAIVSYQVHLPTSAGIGTPDLPGDADVYRRPAQEAVVVYDGTNAGLNTVITNNQSLNTGEVFDVLQITPFPIGDRAIFQ